MKKIKLKSFIRAVITLFIIILTIPFVVFAGNDKELRIESIETSDNTVIVTLNTRFNKFDFSDIDIKAYSDDWYSLEPKITQKLSVINTSMEINDENKTVLKYKILENIKNDRVITKTKEEKFDSISEQIKTADNYVSWQMDNGGWDKAYGELHKMRPWNGNEAKNIYSGWSDPTGIPIATIDNSATYSHIIQIAKVYQKTKNPLYKKSVEKGLDFLFKLQYPSGGFAQVYPARGNYSDYVTFNDNAMINALRMIEDVSKRNYPFNGDLISDDYMKKAEISVEAGISYILKSQIVSNGVLSAWCAQHDPVTYEPKGGRAYELPSISGSESIPIIKFLIDREQTPEIKNAVTSAIAWFKSHYEENMEYDKRPDDGISFKKKEGSKTWYRFYDIETNKPIFSDRDGIPKDNIEEIGAERRFGYTWAGKWSEKLINVMDTIGYYKNLIVAEVVGNNSKDKNGNRLVIGEIVPAQRPEFIKPSNIFQK